MGMYINSATGSLGLTRSLYQTSVMQSTTMKRLSSGIRINSASDDAAGLSLSEKLKSSINGNTVAKNNAQTGIALLNTADSALSNMTNSLERIRNLAVQAANGVYTSEERQMLQSEVSQMSDDISQSYQSAKFSGKNIFGSTNEVAKGASPAQSKSEVQAIAMGYTEAQIIRTAADFSTKINANKAGSFIMTNDIDLSELGVLSSNVITGTFTGTLDGNGHSMNNLNIDTGGAASNYIGLIQHSSGTIKNVSLNASVTATNSNAVGLLLGRALAGSKVENTTISGNILAGGQQHGGVAGTATNISIKNVTSNVSFTLTSALQTVSGGLVGLMTGGSIENSIVAGSIASSGTRVGGVVGQLSGSGIVIKNTTTSATVSGVANVGGFIGRGQATGTIENCSSTSYVQGFGFEVGGFIGLNAGMDISNSYSTGNVWSPDSSIGGFVGGNASGSINSSYATGSVLGLFATGGFTGYNGGTISNSYSTGDVKGAVNTTGGFAGNNYATIQNSYTTSSVDGSGGGFTGGFTGDGTADATNFYKNNLATDTGNAVNGNSSPLPTSGWNSSIWDIDGDIPELLNFSGGSVKIQVGSDRDSTSRIRLNLGLNIGGLGFDVSNQTSALQVITDVDNLMTTLNSKRSEVGASVNKLSSIISIQDNRVNNLSASRSNINDADIASESAKMIKNQIRQQSGVALLSQMNGLDKNLLMQLIG